MSKFCKSFSSIQRTRRWLGEAVRCNEVWIWLPSRMKCQWRAVDAAYIDFSKPLDVVSHSILTSCVGELWVQPSRKVGEELVDLSDLKNDQWFIGIYVAHLWRFWVWGQSSARPSTAPWPTSERRAFVCHTYIALRTPDTASTLKYMGYLLHFGSIFLLLTLAKLSVKKTKWRENLPLLFCLTSA